MPAHLVVAHPYPDLYGSDRTMLLALDGLDREQWRATVVLPHDGPLTEAVRASGHEVFLTPFPVLRRAFLRPAGVVRLAAQTTGGALRLARLLRRLGADVLYANTVTAPVWLAAARLARVPSLAHVHEAEPDLAWPLRAALTFPLTLSTLVVANSESTATTLRTDAPWLARRTQRIYNGIPAPDTAATPLRSRVEDGVRLVLVGRLSPRKGSDVAVRALIELRRRGVAAHLTLVGDVFPGYEWFRDELEHMVAQAGVQSAVTFAGFTDDIWSALAAADVAIVPSRQEPFGNVVVEAMLAGRPVVCSRVQGPAEIVDDHVTGRLIPTDDAPALAAAVIELADDWTATQAMAERARVDATRRFSSQRFQQEMAQVLSTLT